MHTPIFVSYNKQNMLLTQHHCKNQPPSPSMQTTELNLIKEPLRNTRVLP
jgi:hypothetical protein